MGVVTVRATQPSARSRRTAVVGATIGNFVEWYDYIIYGYFAAVLAREFFPSDDPVTSLLVSFTAFGVAYLVRPLGAIVLGTLGDRRGRRAVLSAIILVTSGGTFLIGCLPGYDGWGLAAPLTLVFLRLVQGFCAGGEYGGATAFMVENAPPHRRALYGSWQAATQGLAMLSGALIGAGLAAALTQADLDAWGWRIPFLLALPLGLVGLFLRLRMEDTPAFRAEQRNQSLEASPMRAVLTTEWRSIVRASGIVTGWTTSTFLLIFLPSYLPTAFGYSAAQALLAASAGLLVYTVGCPLVALVSDRIGRRPILLIASIGGAGTAFPVFLLFTTRTTVSAVFGFVLIGVVLACYGAAGSTAISELFATRTRYSALSLSYSVPVSLFGGFSPVVATGLYKATGSGTAPAFYVGAASLVALLAVIGLREGRGAELR